MTLKLYFHPLSSYCHKPLIALYENGTAFEPVFVDPGDEQSSARLRALWPLAKFPVLRDEARDRTIAESSVIIEYLDTFYPGGRAFIPRDPDLAWQARMWDRFFDLHVQTPMQVLVNNALRPAGQADEYGATQARRALRQAYDMLEERMASRTWTLGDDFSLADCAASPALFYVDLAKPLLPQWPHVARYRDRLIARPAYARALKEAEPYFHLVPLDRKPSLIPAADLPA